MAAVWPQQVWAVVHVLVAILMIFGLLSRFAAALAFALCSVALLDSSFNAHNRPHDAVWLFPSAVAAALTLLGPGSLSMDGLLFGLREIRIKKGD